MFEMEGKFLQGGLIMGETFKNGSKWIRADFHLHTDEDKEFKYSGEKQNYINDYVSRLKSENIRIGAITNHNKFNRYEFNKLRKETRNNNIFLIPGVELSVADGANGIHTLIMFNEDEWLENGEDRINQFLDSVFLGIDNRENENARCKCSIIEIIKMLEGMNKDYFIIMAHIEDRCGFFEELKGGRISEITQEKIFIENVLGFQKLRTYDNITKLRDWMGYDIAFVEGSDPKSIEQIGKGKHCYLKVGDYSFDSVKFALKDIHSRVSCNYMPNNKTSIRSIAFEGGKLDGKEIHFAENLNTLIGIRGSGKSSLLELIRYGLNINFGSNSTDMEYKKSLIKNAITSSGKIIVNIVDKHNKHYKVERIFEHEPHILNDRGEELGISLDTIIKNPLYFGQGDLSQTEKCEEALLDKLIGNSNKEVLRNIQNKKLELIDNINKFMRLKDIEEDIKESKTIINNCNHNLELFKKHGVEKKLNDQVIYNNDKLHLENVITVLKKHYKDIKGNIGERTSEIMELLNYSSEINNDIINELNKAISDFIGALNKISCQIEVIENLVDRIPEIEESFNNKLKNVEEDFARVKREIDIPELDISDFMKYNNKLETANKDIASLEKQKDERDRLKISIKSNVRELNNLYLEEFKIYSREIDKINNEQNKLQISIGFKDDKEEFLEHVKENFKGSGLRASNYLDISEKYADYLEMFLDIYLQENKFKEIISDNYYGKVVELFELNIQKLIEYKTPNKISISYHNKPLAQHSIGQRASALILFVLTQKENDLVIIDQPEDDLDNQVIYKELITNLQQKKNDIQFIFATHNANIPVLGDAEQIITCYYNDNEISIKSGSIDKRDIQQRVIKIMEGGRDAFNRRNEIYKLWKYNL